MVKNIGTVPRTTAHVSITHGAATWGDHVTDDEYGQGA